MIMNRCLNIRYWVSLASSQHNLNRNRNLIIHHGLMGSAKNFRSISKNIAFSKYVNVHLIDARNHGQSPHAQTHTRQDLADDLFEYIVEHKLNTQQKPLTLMGHSMGAIALMQFTKKYSNPSIQKYIDRIILIDISSNPLQNKPSFKQTGQMLKNMNSINLNQPTKNLYEDIDRFALTPQVSGLIKNSIIHISENQHKWKVNLPVLVKYYTDIGSYKLLDDSLSSIKWKKPVDVIYGAKSAYVGTEEIQQFKKGYPQMTDENFHRVQDSGHWVHFDQPKQFLKIVDKLLFKDLK